MINLLATALAVGSINWAAVRW